MRTELIDRTEECFAAISGLCAELGPDEWEVQSLCPAWTVREAIAHTVGVEEAMTGWEVSAESLPPFEKMLALTEAAPAMSAPEFRARVGGAFAARRAELAALTDADLDRPALTPVGKATYGRFLAIRVFDLWVHLRDAAIPLGRTTDDGGPAAEMVLDEIQGAIGYIAGKKVGLPDGMTMRIDIDGPAERRIGVAVDGRAAAVDPDSLTDPDVVLAADSTTFIMLACGRIDPQAKIDEGAIRWSGDAEWGERAARNLAFTI